MIGLLLWAGLIAVMWWWGTRPGRRTRQDKRDLANVTRARSKHPRSTP